jgi:hypothetical protein
MSDTEEVAGRLDDASDGSNEAEPQDEGSEQSRSSDELREGDDYDDESGEAEDFNVFESIIAEGPDGDAFAAELKKADERARRPSRSRGRAASSQGKPDAKRHKTSDIPSKHDTSSRSARRLETVKQPERSTRSTRGHRSDPKLTSSRSTVTVRDELDRARERERKERELRELERKQRELAQELELDRQREEDRRKKREREREQRERERERERERTKPRESRDVRAREMREGRDGRSVVRRREEREPPVRSRDRDRKEEEKTPRGKRDEKNIAQRKPERPRARETEEGGRESRRSKEEKKVKSPSAHSHELKRDKDTEIIEEVTGVEEVPIDDGMAEPDEASQMIMVEEDNMLDDVTEELTEKVEVEDIQPEAEPISADELAESEPEVEIREELMEVEAVDVEKQGASGDPIGAGSPELVVEGLGQIVESPGKSAGSLREIVKSPGKNVESPGRNVESVAEEVAEEEQQGEEIIGDELEEVDTVDVVPKSEVMAQKRSISPIVFAQIDDLEKPKPKSVAKAVSPGKKKELQKPSDTDTRTQKLSSSQLFHNTRYFVMKSNNHENIQIAKGRSVWSTPPMNERKLNKAFHECKNVILIFSVQESGMFQGD